MRNSYYFSHDFGARNDPKLQKLQMEMGQEGKGIFWDLIEIMYEEDGYLVLSECESYAFALRTHCDKIKNVIFNFNLFQNDGDKFWSGSVLKRLEKINKRQENSKNAAKIRWNNATAMRPQCDRNAMKRKEIKGKENNINKEISEIKKDNGFDIFFKLWNETMENRIIKLSDTRIKKIKMRVKQDKEFIDHFKICTLKIKESKFLSGENDRGWKPDFDWVIANDTNYMKILEDKFYAKETNKPGTIKNLYERAFGKEEINV